MLPYSNEQGKYISIMDTCKKWINYLETVPFYHFIHHSGSKKT